MRGDKYHNFAIIRSRNTTNLDRNEVSRRTDGENKDHNCVIYNLCKINLLAPSKAGQSQSVSTAVNHLYRTLHVVRFTQIKDMEESISLYLTH